VAADYNMDSEFSKEQMDLAHQTAEMIFAATKIKKGLLDEEQKLHQARS
jgi:hypothetical protein